MSVIVNPSEGVNVSVSMSLWVRFLNIDEPDFLADRLAALEFFYSWFLKGGFSLRSPLHLYATSTEFSMTKYFCPMFLVISHKFLKRMWSKNVWSQLRESNFVLQCQTFSWVLRPLERRFGAVLGGGGVYDFLQTFFDSNYGRYSGSDERGNDLICTSSIVFNRVYIYIDVFRKNNFGSR